MDNLFSAWLCVDVKTSYVGNWLLIELLTVLCKLFSSEPYYQTTTDTRLGEENKGHQLLTKMGESSSTIVT